MAEGELVTWNLYHKITNDRWQVIGDVYDPGHGRHLQNRDKKGRIIGYVGHAGTVTDSWQW
jgi:hypothetical protein